MKLRACPFCHMPPVEYEPQHAGTWTVECANPECEVQPHTYDYGCSNTQTDDPKTAARSAWNGSSRTASPNTEGE